MTPWPLPPGSIALARKVLTGFVIAAAGGWIFHVLALPAPWVAGGTIATAAAALLRVELAMPRRLRDVVFVLLGISMGAGVTPETVDRLPQWPVSLFLVGVSIFAVTGGSYAWFRKVAGWDWRTAFLASVPGALSYVLAVAVDSGADLRRVAVAQSLRVILLVAGLPFLIAGLTVGELSPPPSQPGAPGDLLILGVVGVAAGLAAQWARVPAGLLTGAFAASAILHGAGIVGANLPDILLIPSFLGIAVLIGTRFAGTDLALLRDALLVSLGAFVIGGLLALACAGAAVLAISVGWGQAALAFAPGGLEAMTALSFALALDPAYVAAHQLFRFVAIALFVPAAFKLVSDRYGPDR